MAISPLELHGMVTRTQDFTTLKQNEDNKAMTNQAMFQTQMNKEEERKAGQVEKSQQSEAHQREKDAKEKGNGEYTGDGGRRRKREGDISAEGIVIKKTAPHFDCSI